MRKFHRLLVINPGATTTKIGVFNDDFCLFEKSILHPYQELSSFTRVIEQQDYRKKAILDTLDTEGINLSKLDAVCGRGGLLRPIPGGTYLVNDPMLQDLRMGYNGEHISNLGGILAYEIAIGLNIPAYIVDPVVVDELCDFARVTGMPEISRISIFHALNQKSVARQAAQDLGKSYENIQLVIAHIGGGITVGAHKQGQVIDVNNGLHGDGPFSPERAGTIPAGDLVDMCFSDQYSREEIMKKIVGEGGLMGYLKTTDTEKVEAMIDDGDEKAKFIYHAMAYQVAKEIGAMATVLKGKVDAVVLTGDIAERKQFVELISNQVDWIADVLVYPGQNELLALAQGTLRVLKKEEEPKEYTVH